MIRFNDLDNKTFLLTGVTGYIGSLLLQTLEEIAEKEKAAIHIFVIVRDIEKAKAMLSKNKIEGFICGDLTQEGLISNINVPIDYIIHCAATTKSQQMVTEPVETADGIVLGTRNILELARKSGVKSMVYLSSMEVYGKINKAEKVKENELGEIDIHSVRSCYSLGKRMAENYCSCYHKEYAVPVKIARLAQVFGQGVLSGETRIYAQFANAVKTNMDIILHTSGNSVGNYVDAQDAINAIFLLLFYGKDGEAYNVVNEENTMRIREMAELVADKIAAGKIKVTYNMTSDNQLGYAPETELRLSSEKIQRLGWTPTADLETMYRKMLN